jgi:environmental stress-induced protein Ves
MPIDTADTLNAAAVDTGTTGAAAVVAKQVATQAAAQTTTQPTGVTLLRGADLVAAPWKNGGGVTREVAAYPQGASLDAFLWRVSIADVAQAGPFSRFEGIDRTLVLLSGAGMLLDEAGGPPHALTQPLDMAHFAGETAIDARLVDGATRDFNLMVRRGAARGEVEVWQGEDAKRDFAPLHALSADVALLFCTSGSLQVTLGSGAAITLTTDDTLRIDAPQALDCRLSGTGALLAIRLHYA